MESKIDWSNAPEDADKYNTHSGMFYKGERPYLQVFIHEQWMPSAIMKSNELFVYRPTTPSWSGEGLPPVGVVCMANGYQVVIVAHHCNGIHAIYAESEYDGLLYYGEPNEFRHIRTQEQIAADEREAAIKEIQREIMPAHEYVAEIILDAITRIGYRKP